MAKASTATIDTAQAEHFGALAGDWWDPKGSSAMLHRLNPVRLRYLREQIDRHWGCDPRSLRPLSGRTVLDVGCGAGLLCEPLARLGGAVTGIDAAEENIEAARTHAHGQGLTINYLAGEVGELAERFDLVTCMEVIEHVACPQAFAAALSARLAPGGLLVLSTPNRTALSRLAMITIGEGTGLIPKGTHEWNRFLAPDELSELLAAEGLAVVDVRGIAFSPTAGLTLSEDMKLNYLVAVHHSRRD